MSTSVEVPEPFTVRVRPVVRPSLVLLLLLFVLGTALPGISTVVPAAAFMLAVVVNFLLARRHVKVAAFQLATPPIGRSGDVMNWTVTTDGVAPDLGGWLLIGASRVQRVPVVPGRAATLPVVLDKRGVYSIAQLQLMSVGPLFLPLHAGASVRRDLATPLVIAPALIEVPELLAAVRSRRAGEGDQPGGGDVPGGPESIRPFQLGDRMSAVHWGATARTGEVHVKELEQLGGAALVTLVVDHVDGSDTGERILAEATWLTHQLLAQGMAVHLLTPQVRVTVHSATHADEVLAGVAPGVVPVVPAGQRVLAKDVGDVRVIEGWWMVDQQRVVLAGRALPVRPNADTGWRMTMANSVQPSPQVPAHRDAHVGAL
jgi:uncharacterized protein (DUF58 family)